jgi:phospholipid transport system substrate-binding protein
MLKISSYFIFSALFLAPAFGAVESPKAVVQTIIDRAKTLDQKPTHEANAKTIESLVDFKKLTLDALGDNAAKANPSQKQEIQDLLRKIITKTVYPEAPAFFRNVDIQYTGEEKLDSKTHITSVVTKGEKRSTVEYWLANESGQYRVVDLAIEGERWVENVHDQFEEIIQKQGVGGLITKMKKRLNQLNQK